MAVGEESAQTMITITCKAAVATSDLINDLIKKVIDKGTRTKTSNVVHGKMSLKQLSQKNVSLDSIPLQNADAAQVKHVLKKMGIDFSAVKNNNDTITLYFKGSDNEIILNSLKNYISDVDNNNRDDKNDRENKSPIDERIDTAKDKAEKTNQEKAQQKEKEQHKQKSGREQER